MKELSVFKSCATVKPDSQWKAEREEPGLWAAATMASCSSGEPDEHPVSCQNASWVFTLVPKVATLSIFSHRTETQRHVGPSIRGTGEGGAWQPTACSKSFSEA